jgi:penicillin-binding protein 1B
MMKAARYKQYGDVKQFAPPSGVVRVGVDPKTGLLAGPYCTSFAAYFIDGTQPVSQCPPPETQEIEVSFTEDGGATQRAASDQAPVPLTSTEQTRVIPAIQSPDRQPPVQALHVLRGGGAEGEGWPCVQKGDEGDPRQHINCPPLCRLICRAVSTAVR